MTEAFSMLAAALFGYVMGSIPTGYLVGQRQGIDIRQYGSKNIGATNVLRTLGPVLAAVVFAADTLKGVLPVAAAIYLGGDQVTQLVAGAGALAGHTWPFTLRFKGGRAVATSFGVVMMLSPWAALCGLAIFTLVVGVTRYVSLGSMLGAVLTAALMPLFKAPLLFTLFAFAVAALIVYRHKPNIERLLAGTESKIGQRVVVPGRTDEERKAR